MEYLGDKRMVKTSYAVIIPCRNGEKTIGQTLESLFSQTVKPLKIIVIDDASNDATAKILERFPHVSTIRLNHNYPRNFIRVPKLLNIGFQYIPKHYRYAMISGDDTIYSNDYMEKIIACFQQNQRLKIASGSAATQQSKIPDRLKIEGKTPSGTGRVFQYAFLRKHLPFPISIGWEGDILFKALREGEIRAFDNITFKHTRAYGSYSIRTFGHAAYVLGYPFIFFLARSIKTFLTKDTGYRFKVLFQLLGYIEYYITRQKTLPNSNFVKNHYKRRISRFLLRLLGGTNEA